MIGEVKICDGLKLLNIFIQRMNSSENQSEWNMKATYI